MDKTPFGRTGFQVSRLAFGGGEIGYLHTEQQRVERILNLLLDGGVNVIDTAASYKGSEEAIGKAIGHRRGDYVLVSKCGNPVPGTTGAAWSAELIAQTVDRSLQNLRTDHLDVMLLHTCDLATLQKGEAIGALVKAREAGKIRHAGYSGEEEAAAYAAAHGEIAVLETSISIADQVNIDAVLPVAQKHDVGVMSKRTIANAAWKDPNEQQGVFKDYSREYHKRLAHMKVDLEELGFGGRPAREAWPELALRFTLSQPGVHTAIIGTTSPENARRNAEIAAKGPLPAKVVAKVREAFRKGQAEAGETWTGQT